MVIESVGKSYAIIGHFTDSSAACHCCTMVSETSCERANRFLDRRFVVPLPGGGDEPGGGAGGAAPDDGSGELDGSGAGLGSGGPGGGLAFFADYLIA